ncbi:MAG: FAD-dependent oxidoreductase, partial [Rubrimonas sp.]
MSEQQDADVIVVGGGAAGLACALALAQGGQSVIVLDAKTVERRADPEFDGRAYAIAATSRRCLQALGVWDRVADRAQAFSAIEIHDGRLGDPGPVRLRFDGEAVDDAPFAALIEDRFLRGALLDAVAAEPRIDHRSPVAVAGMTAEGGRARVTLADGGSLTSALVVAADGRRSPLAAAA